MKIIKTNDYEEMSIKTLDVFIETINNCKNQNRINVAITGGRTPLMFYKMLIENLNRIEILEKVHFYNFDEIPLKDDLSTGLTFKDLDELFYTPGKINSNNIHQMNFLNWKDFIKQLNADGGLDLVLLGIGIDGHFCGNLSGVTKFGDSTREISMIDTQNNISVPKLDTEKFHEKYVTMGPREIMQSKNILMIANGEAKANVIDQILNGPVVEQVPSSLLTLHPNFTLIIDKEANSKANI
ncbi:glucosamine-6-phosphate deaminase [Spiroplasma diminutum]|uniref:Glucosamine-6-phosphate deaminase n=1 Tax=Spiroplasma diminutum CUAS-1 TaxID=1276221 RepID=S5MJJ0_9MOLU|nr:glucosamine-6-phosphate deaminase [Spiroplasma diminutum]AGR42140.1 glucosamine-6-phosphate deaminase [Spiroplasma diminutum CUAS-1]